MTKTSQNNNLNKSLDFSKHFYEYHSEKGFATISLQLLSLVEIESLIVETSPYFEHTVPLLLILFHYIVMICMLR